MEYTKDDIHTITFLGEYVEKDRFRLEDVKEYLSTHNEAFYEKAVNNGWDTFEPALARLQLAKSNIKRTEHKNDINVASLRKKAHMMLARGLPIKVAKNIEISVHNYVLKQHSRDDYRRFYARKIRSLVFNLTFEQFKSEILSKRYKYIDIPYLRHDQMCPDGPHAMMKRYIKQKDADILRCKMLLETEKEDSKGLYTCKGCRSTATVFQAVQIRSADEPMTIFITCLNCENRWKE